MSEITQILSRLGSGDRSASAELLPIVYDELRSLAAAKLSQEQPGQTLQATALVHEAYLRLLGSNGDVQWDNRAHFFGAAAEAIRRILVEQARRKSRQKHGGGFQRHDCELAGLADSAPSVDVFALDEALNDFAVIEPIKCELVKLRYFSGLTLDEAANTLGISSATADRYWKYARAWLAKRLREEHAESRE